MVIGSKHKLKNVKPLKLVINGSILENVAYQKILGIYVDDTLTLKTQIDYVCKKLSSKLTLLRKIKHFLTFDSRMIFYNAYILPILDYCCHIWGKESRKSTSKVSQIQKRIGKNIYDMPLRSSSAHIFEKLKCLPFNDRCKYHTAVLVYKTLNGMAPSYMTELIILSNNETYNLRSISRKHICLSSIPRTNYLKDTFHYYSISV